MNEKLEELKRDVKEHLDNEMELLTKLLKSLPELSSEERDEWHDSFLTHPHAKSLLLLDNSDFEKVRMDVRKRQGEPE